MKKVGFVGFVLAIVIAVVFIANISFATVEENSNIEENSTVEVVAEVAEVVEVAEVTEVAEVAEVAEVSEVEEVAEVSEEKVEEVKEIENTKPIEVEEKEPKFVSVKITYEFLMGETTTTTITLESGEVIEYSDTTFEWVVDVEEETEILETELNMINEYVYKNETERSIITVI